MPANTIVHHPTLKPPRQAKVGTGFADALIAEGWKPGPHPAFDADAQKRDSAPSQNATGDTGKSGDAKSDAKS